ncbi:DUF6471 domain-containing protein [Caballeronia grimmiae]|uniref:DUF6471 domain-containing protein n=1 Tax=Caballeronia grimmiae TaxID=1071679 RepID=UPI0038B88AB9
MSEADTPWARLASRVTRVALARKDVTYGALVEALVSDGEPGGDRAIVSRISRGTLKLSLFLHILSVTRVRPPERWSDALANSDDWDRCASYVIAAEMSRQPPELSKDLVASLARLGTVVAKRTLDAQIENGSLALSLFLQLLYLLNSNSLDRFIDQDDLAEAAKNPVKYERRSSPEKVAEIR